MLITNDSIVPSGYNTVSMFFIKKEEWIICKKGELSPRFQLVYPMLKRALKCHRGNNYSDLVAGGRMSEDYEYRYIKVLIADYDRTPGLTRE